MGFNRDVATGRKPLLDGKIAVITGGGNGIGRVAVGMFIEAGALVVTSDIDAEALDQVKKEYGEAVTTVVADTSTVEGVRSVVATTQETHGRVDALYNNAGVGALAEGLLRVHETPYEIFEKTIRLNLWSVFAMSRETIPLMQSTGGSIINVASINAQVAIPGSVSYISAKGGVLSMTRSIAFDYAADGIRANVLVPGYIDTRMVSDYTNKAPDPAAAVKEVGDAHLLGRMGDPQEVAAAALWLASDASTFMTGSALTVDGGYLAK
ncbi:SDR family NAD(P)-dependent oxidoreductase [Streptomyces sp. MBT62]|uniref:SDR family NAD(P)-dependent oxidoreductase n=1 Tax=Streptomyces sp. MBT62 TaxID=2800410 RepID=UPI00190C8D1E|nr:SDR family oxidoreductase [Streptomyces sp. MBT62]MBK3566286.1 SDR family oxidoreductase [Streptomyces sp. MBT62]